MSTPQKSNASGGKWKVSSKSEARKLSNREDDWNLAGNEVRPRTRQRRGTRTTSTSSADAVEEIVVCTPFVPPGPRQLFTPSTSETMTADSSSSRFYKPPHMRIIIEVAAAVNLLKSYLTPCPECKATLLLSFPTTCIASGCLIKCDNEFCTFADVAAPAGSS